MWGSVDVLEMKIEVERKLNEFEDMLKRALPELNKDSDIDMKKYVEKRLRDSGCYDIPCNEVYSLEQWKSLLHLVRKDKVSAVYYAIIIGFMNGVEWERKK